jgi:hypothetical protein
VKVKKRSCLYKVLGQENVQGIRSRSRKGHYFTHKVLGQVQENNARFKVGYYETICYAGEYFTRDHFGSQTG